MREIGRPTVLLPTLRAQGPGGRQAQKHVEIRSRDASAVLSFPAHWNNEDVRGSLYAFHGRACAYCGCELPRNDRGDVDHFRPKGSVHEDPGHGGYWWLAYAFDNYLLSCTPCNRHRKRDGFPLFPGEARIRYRDRSRLPQEKRLLLDPASDPVEDWLQVEWRQPLCLIAPRAHLTQNQREQVEKTLAFFRINEDYQLVRERNRVRREVFDALDADNRDRARTLAIRFRPHSLVAKQMLAHEAPELLPTGEQELAWLLEDTFENLLLALKMMGDGPSDLQKRQAKELLWQLATLWWCPPKGTSSQVEAFLERRQVRSHVEPYLKGLTTS